MKKEVYDRAKYDFDKGTVRSKGHGYFVPNSKEYILTPTTGQTSFFNGVKGVSETALKENSLFQMSASKIFTNSQSSFSFNATAGSFFRVNPIWFNSVQGLYGFSSYDY